jgi:hypothetical protein
MHCEVSENHGALRILIARKKEGKIEQLHWLGQIQSGESYSPSLDHIIVNLINSLNNSYSSCVLRRWKSCTDWTASFRTSFKGNQQYR